jgi:hypothetical protein
MNNVKWDLPSKPQQKPIKSIPINKDKIFVPLEEGIFLNKESAKNLLFNIDELNIYIEKQNAIIESMKKYYNAK